MTTYKIETCFEIATATQIMTAKNLNEVITRISRKLGNDFRVETNDLHTVLNFSVGDYVKITEV